MLLPLCAALDRVHHLTRIHCRQNLSRLARVNLSEQVPDVQSTQIIPAIRLSLIRHSRTLAFGSKLSVYPVEGTVLSPAHVLLIINEDSPGDPEGQIDGCPATR